MSTIERVTRHLPAASSSRKRPYAEITRSESRSQSPQLPSKRRRRTSRSPSISHQSIVSTASPSSSLPSPPSSSPEPTSHSPHPRIPSTRTVGDGLDFRRPVMSAPNPQPQTIDLTLDDDYDTPPPPSSPWAQESDISSPSPPPASDEGYFRSPQANGQIEVIDLADSDAEADPAPIVRRHSPDVTAHRRPVRLSSSPEVEFVRENIRHPEPIEVPRRRDDDLVNAGEVRPQLPGIFHTFRNAATHVFGQFVNPPQNRPPAPTTHQFDPLVVEGDDYADVQFDYQQQGFAMETRDSEAPAIVGEPYKAPPKAKDGFTRNLEEEEILLCPFCKEELAAGDGDVKQQVWIVKQCGHVYCGACANNRALMGNKREKRKANQHKTLPFKACAVDGCNKPVTSKSAMFQIYL